MAYQYLQMMPKIAQGDANKVWVIPSEITKALEGLGSSIHEIVGIPKDSGGPRKRVDMGSMDPAKLEGSGALADRELSQANAAVQEAIAAAERRDLRRRDERSTSEPPPEPPAPPVT